MKDHFCSLFAPVGSTGGGVGSGPGGVRPRPGGVRSRERGVHSSLRETALSGSGGLIADPNMRRTDLDALHPVLREAVVELEDRFLAEGLPFRLFEAFRTPQRQKWLFAQGRSRARAWESYHQFGLAVDYVLWVNNAWSWSSTGVYSRYWKRLPQLGGELGLEPLPGEMPHLQVSGLALGDLRGGRYPEGGDDLWRDNLEAAAIGWPGDPAGPALSSLRPQAPPAR